MSTLKYRSLLVATLLVVSISANAGPDTMKVCYVPFDYETFNATTPSSIFEQTCRSIRSNSPTAVDLQKYVSDRSNPANDQPDFDFRVVRVVVTEGDKPPIFVDRSGVVLASYRMYQLPQPTLIALKKLLDEFFGDSAKK
jgi:hypothetical protein